MLEMMKKQDIIKQKNLRDIFGRNKSAELKLLKSATVGYSSIFEGMV